jgi:hypothetical protein
LALIQIKVRLPGAESIASLCSGAGRATKTLDRRLAEFVPVSTTAEDVMKFVKAAFVAALAVTNAGAFTSRAEAAPLPTNVAAMKAALDTPVVQAGYGRWHGGWGYRGWGGYGGWGNRGWGYRGWGLRSAYYGNYPYYGRGYAESGGYADDYCPPYGDAGFYPGHRAWHYNDYGW